MERLRVASVALALLAAGCGGSGAAPPTVTASSHPPTAQPAVQLSVGSKWAISDTDSVTITGTTTPGAVVTISEPGQNYKPATGKADAQGVFSFTVNGVPEGDLTVLLLASEFGYTDSERTVTVTRTLSPASYKASAASIPYNQLIKDPASLSGRIVIYTGQVFQYDSNTTTSHLIVSVTDGGYGFWTDNIWIDLDPATGQSVFNKTVIRFWGTVVGPYTYTTTTNGSLTIPEVKLRYLDVVSQP